MFTKKRRKPLGKGLFKVKKWKIFTQRRGQACRLEHAMEFQSLLRVVMKIRSGMEVIKRAGEPPVGILCSRARARARAHTHKGSPE